MKKTILALSILAMPMISQAGVITPTAHSRANCVGFNESITWHLGHSYMWRVESHHYPKGWTHPVHIMNTGTHVTWRAAACHPNEAYSSRGDQWYVNGFHFYYPDGSKERLDTMTGVGDCSIYDGWWDH